MRGSAHLITAKTLRFNFGNYASFANAELRVSPIVDRGFSVDPTVSAGGQVIDAVLELWLQQGANDAVAQRILSESPDMGIIGAFRVDELILKEA